MDNKKVWIVEEHGGKVAVCSSEGSAYRRALRYYVDHLEDSLTEIRDGITINTTAENVYEMVIYDLKSFARIGSIDDTLDMHETELFD